MIDEVSLFDLSVAARWSSPEIGDLNPNPTRQRRDGYRAEESLTHVSGCDFWPQPKPEVLSGLFTKCESESCARGVSMIGERTT